MQYAAASYQLNAKTGEIFHMGVDSQGAHSHGKWEVKENGDLVLGIGFIGGDNREGTLSLRYCLEDEDTLMVTIELPQPITVKMIRAKPTE